MKIVDKKIEELKPYDKNPRINDEAVDYVANSIKEFGFKVPIVIDKDNVIVAGHTRLKASKKLGLDKVPCIVADDLTEEQIKAFRLADNKVSEKADWDFSMLDDELKDIDIDMEQFGFDEVLEIEEQEIIEDEVPDVPEEAKAKLGDIYQLGNHRLMCGDSTKEEDVAKLMNGVKADMVFTDPPYGMNLDTDFSEMKSELNTFGKNQHQGGTYKKVIGDNEDFKDELITTIFNNFDYCKEIFVWGADYYPELLKDYKKGNYIVWDKRLDQNLDKGYGSCFELCWSKNKHKKFIARVKWFGLFGTEKEFDKKRIHPTQKPTELARWFIDKYSKENGLIVDIYGGSGSTLIACEQLNRKCYMMELDPHYIDVIIQRWENFTGKNAVKIEGE